MELPVSVCQITQIDVNIGAGNFLIPLGNKPLSEPIMTNFQGTYCMEYWS